MLGIKNLKIGIKVVIAPAIATIFMVVIAVFANNALRSDKETLKEIVEVKFETYKMSSNLLTDIDMYHSILYKLFSYASGGYAQSQIDEQLNILSKLQKTIKKEALYISKSKILDKKSKKAFAAALDDLSNYDTAVIGALDMLSIDVGMATPMLSITDEFFLAINIKLDAIKKAAMDANKTSFINAL